MSTWSTTVTMLDSMVCSCFSRSFDVICPRSSGVPAEFGVPNPRSGVRGCGVRPFGVLGPRPTIHGLDGSGVDGIIRTLGSVRQGARGRTLGEPVP